MAIKRLPSNAAKRPALGIHRRHASLWRGALAWTHRRHGRPRRNLHRRCKPRRLQRTMAAVREFLLRHHQRTPPVPRRPQETSLGGSGTSRWAPPTTIRFLAPCSNPRMDKVTPEARRSEFQVMSGEPPMGRVLRGTRTVPQCPAGLNCVHPFTFSPKSPIPQVFIRFVCDFGQGASGHLLLDPHGRPGVGHGQHQSPEDRWSQNGLNGLPRRMILLM